MLSGQLLNKRISAGCVVLLSGSGVVFTSGASFRLAVFLLFTFNVIKGQWQQNFLLSAFVKLTNGKLNFIFLHAYCI